MSIAERIQESVMPSKTPRKKGAAAEMDILDKLGQEHDEVQELLKKLVDSGSGAERTQLFKKIKAALIPHLRAEEKVVYDRVLKLKEKDAKVDGNEGYDEHEVGDVMVKKLSRMRNKASPEFTAAAKVLKELVDHHIEEEESALWDHVKENFSEDERLKMNRAFEAAKKKVRIPA